MIYSGPDPHGGRGDYQYIDLVEVVWKVVTVIINRRFTASIVFHDVLRGFQEGRGTGTSSLEVKLIQKLMATREKVLYAISLDLHKAYSALDRDIYLEIL